MSEKVNSVLLANGIAPEEVAAVHYGVVGMKWGVRKDRSTSSGASDSKKSKRTKTAKPSKPVTTKTPNTFKNRPTNRRMSDAELRNKLNRLQMEKQFKELTTKPQSKNFVVELMADTGKQVARDVLKKSATVGLQLAIEAVAKNASGGNKVFFEAMAATGGKKKKSD